MDDGVARIFDVPVDCFRSGSAVGDDSGSGCSGVCVLGRRGYVASQGLRQDLAICVIRLDSWYWILDEGNIVSLGFRNLGSRILVEAISPGLGTPDTCGGFGFSLRVSPFDFAPLSAEGATHLRRFGEAELCLVCVSPNLLEKLARG